MADNYTVRFDDIDVKLGVNSAGNTPTRDIYFDTITDNLDLVNPNDGIASGENYK